MAGIRRVENEVSDRPVTVYVTASEKSILAAKAKAARRSVSFVGAELLRAGLECEGAAVIPLTPADHTTLLAKAATIGYLSVSDFVQDLAMAAVALPTEQLESVMFAAQDAEDKRLSHIELDATKPVERKPKPNTKPQNKPQNKPNDKAA